MATTSLSWGTGTRPPLMSGGGVLDFGLVAILDYQVVVLLLRFFLRDIFSVDRRAYQHAAGKAERHDYPWAHYHSRRDHCDLLDPLGESEHRRTQLCHQRAHRRAAVSQYLFLWGHGFGAIAG